MGDDGVDQAVRERFVDMYNHELDLLSVPYVLNMSSKYQMCENSYASLVIEEDDLSTGAGTNTDVNSYIEAILKKPQLITHIKLKPLTAHPLGIL